MSKSIVLIQGHPDPDPNHLCRALASSYVAGAGAAGHAVTVIDVAELEFPILRRSAAYDFEPVPQSLAPARDAILAADHIVVVFPLWLGSLPALTKAFFEQVLHRRDMFEQTGHGKWPKGRLRGKSARMVVTMGMPAAVFRIWFLGHGVKAVERGILAVVGVRPIRETLFGNVEGIGDATRLKWIARMRRLGERAA